MNALWSRGQALCGVRECEVMFGADSDPGGELANYSRPLVMIIGCYSNSPATTLTLTAPAGMRREEQVDYTLSGWTWRLVYARF